MSMLSEQRDKLRKVASELQSVIDGLNKGRVTYDGLMDTLNYGILCLNGAADTIWQLRNDCVDLRDENAKLRERVAELDELLPDNGRWFSAEIVEAYVAEIAKLRELAKAAWGCVKRQVSCDECRMVCCGCTLQSAMRKLGIEVEE